MRKEELRIKLKEIRAWIRQEAIRLGLPGKGKSYSDCYKKSWTVKVGLVPKGWHRFTEDEEESDKTIKQIAETVNQKWGDLLVSPAGCVAIRHGSCSCAGYSMGIWMKFKLEE